ncbi:MULTISPECIES: response regulator transcription factor [unclassified Nocardia]|uniref:response regulator transcription factor n=1 Tax=unclassified Nocardia TaxID=2637762 RepID=UPI001CE42C76|nr:MULTISPECIES: response regulator transcription factor [unclassified Nocardia]
MWSTELVRVLVVEDDAGLAPVLVRGLREEGHAVDHAATMAAADELCSYNDYALVVLDLGLPDGDGLTLCRQLKADGRTRVLVLTARGSATERVKGLDTGADDYLTKPFDFGELAARVRAVLRRPVTVGGSELRVGDIRLDMATHRVFRGEVLIPLTAKEFAVLQYFVQQAGQTVTRTELLEQVWDMHYEGTSNIVDVFVSTLRRKLDLPTEHTRLDTVRGVGFRLFAEG